MLSSKIIFWCHYYRFLLTRLVDVLKAFSYNSHCPDGFAVNVSRLRRSKIAFSLRSMEKRSICGKSTSVSNEIRILNKISSNILNRRLIDFHLTTEYREFRNCIVTNGGKAVFRNRTKPKFSAVFMGLWINQRIVPKQKPIIFSLNRGKRSSTYLSAAICCVKSLFSSVSLNKAFERLINHDDDQWISISLIFPTYLLKTQKQVLLRRLRE